MEIDGTDTILTFDFDGAPGPATGTNFNTFARIHDVQIDGTEDLFALQLTGAIEFV